MIINNIEITIARTFVDAVDETVSDSRSRMDQYTTQCIPAVFPAFNPSCFTLSGNWFTLSGLETLFY